MQFSKSASIPACHRVARLAFLLDRCHGQIALRLLGSRVRSMAVDAAGCIWVEALPLGQKDMEVIVETVVSGHLRVALEARAIAKWIRCYGRVVVVTSLISD